MFALEINEILQATPPKLRGEVGMYGNKAKGKSKTQGTEKQRASSDGSQVTAAAELIAVPPLLSYHSKQQRS